MANRFTSRNKLKISVVFLCALSVCCIFCLIFSACDRSERAQKELTDCYDISLEYDGQDEISASQEILYTSPSNCENIVLHLYANAFGKDGDTSAIDILSAQLNRQNVDFEIYGNKNTLLKIPCDLIEGEICTLSFEYIVKLPKSNERLGKTADGTINLSCFYPVVAQYENGWREDDYFDFGDPFYTRCSSFFVSITCDKNMQIASSGKIEETEIVGDAQRAHIKAENIRDFGAVIGNLNKASCVANLNSDSVSINYFYRDDANAEGTLYRIANAIRVFSDTFGDYPYNSFTIAQSELSGGGGMEYGTFAIVSPSVSRENYLDAITHEIAHQWWYNVVGNDQLNNAWLDEGLSEFCTYYYRFLTDDRDAYASNMAGISQSYREFSELKHSVGFDGSMNRHLSTYLTSGEYVAVNYYKGAMMFDLIRGIMGDAKFCNALASYYSANKFKIATQQDLISAFATQGYNVQSIIENWTNDKALV